MMDLAAIKKANDDPKAFHASRLTDGQKAGKKERVEAQRLAHGARVEARQRQKMTKAEERAILREIMR
jgi:hypothetical protein